MLKSLRAAGAAVIALTAFAGPMSGVAIAQDDEYRAQLEAQLDALRSLATTEGMNVMAGPFFGALEESAKESYTLTVSRGGEYLLIGVCDNDCSDLDLRIYNQLGELLVEDTLEDDAPVVELNPTMTGRVRVEVEMYACSSEPCYFAVEAYSKN